ncbi:MAG: shikimate dehydrogenase [Chloroflexota bacterium]|nr:shikimate dehydrogenase [Chloroflexota bacterium]
MIDGHTKLVGLIGWPVEHSLSPVMHNAAFDALGLNWRYLPLPVPPGQVEVAVRGLAALGFQGANVTVPHKQAVMSRITSLSPNARGVGAVNTLIIGRGADGKSVIMGHNTDDKGFVGALRRGGFEPEDGGDVVVVGAGGAARAVVFGLLWSGMGTVTVLNRTLERALALVSDLGPLPQPLPEAGRGASPFPPRKGDQEVRLRTLPLTPETLIESARAADLLVNATTVGMWPHVGDSVWPDGVPVPSHLTVFDLVYNPLETQLLRQARQSGARAIDGLGMLVRQGALAFEMWTNQGFTIEEIVEPMRAACERAMQQ